MKYLDPKNDLTFRKVFGEHPDLLISFLNNMLPLAPGQEIVEIQYLQSELIPELPILKRSVVDVRCTDNQGRTFLVEMQMYWSKAFKQRILFNAGKAYVLQLKGAKHYRELRPVYGLSLVNDIFLDTETLKDEYYHHYSLVHNRDNNERIEGLEFVFVELPKFQAKSFSDKRLQTLWLRFLTEINETTNELPQDLMNDDLIRTAIEYVEKQGFSEAELLHYDNYWDAIRIEKEGLLDAEERYEAAMERIAALEVEQQKARQREEEARREAEEALLREAEAVLNAEKAKHSQLEAQRTAEQAQKQADEAQKQADEAQKQIDEAQKQADQSQKQAEEAQRQAEEAHQREIASRLKLAAKMKRYGEALEEIAKETGLCVEEIAGLE